MLLALLPEEHGRAYRRYDPFIDEKICRGHETPAQPRAMQHMWSLSSALSCAPLNKGRGVEGGGGGVDSSDQETGGHEGRG